MGDIMDILSATMRNARHAFMLLSAAAALAASGFFVMQMGSEAAGTMEAVPPGGGVPAGALVQHAEPPKAVDRRLAGLKTRSDGARLLWAAEDGLTILRAGFIDNETLVITATTTAVAGAKGYRLFSYGLLAREEESSLKSWVERLSSNHRPANKNADAFCFSQRNEKNAHEIYCVDHSWKNPRRLTTHDGPEDLLNPAISPEGGRVIFEVSNDRAKAGSSIWIIGLNGSGLRQLTRGADDRNPTWSEDGGRILFQRRLPDGNWDFYAMRADGSEAAPVLRTPNEDERFPVLLGNATTALIVGPKDGPGRVKLFDIVTKSGRWLTSGETGPETDLSISPDGKLTSFIAPVSADQPDRIGVWLKNIR